MSKTAKPASLEEQLARAMHVISAELQQLPAADHLGYIKGYLRASAELSEDVKGAVIALVTSSKAGAPLVQQKRWPEYTIPSVIGGAALIAVALITHCPSGAAPNPSEGAARHAGQQATPPLAHVQPR